MAFFFLNEGSNCCENGKTGNKQRNRGNLLFNTAVKEADKQLLQITTVKILTTVNYDHCLKKAFRTPLRAFKDKLNTAGFHSPADSTAVLIQE